MFRPQPGKYFVVHVEVVTDQGMVVRISFSNLFKEFKSTSTWLQFPYISSKENCNDSISKSDELSSRSEQKDGKPLLHVRWTLLTLDLRGILSHYLHSTYTYLKNVKLCANLLVRNVFTSDIEYSPLVDDGARTPSGEKLRGYVQPLPREMAFLVTRGHSFAEMYDYIRFPPQPVGRVKPVVSHAHLIGRHPGMVDVEPETKTKVMSARVGHSSSAKTGTKEHRNGVRGGKSGEHGMDVVASLTKAEGKKELIERSGAKESLVRVSGCI